MSKLPPMDLSMPKHGCVRSINHPAGVNLTLSTEFKFKIVIPIPVSEKNWLKWKGRNIPRWKSLRWYQQYRSGREVGSVTYTCYDPDKVSLMTPEKLEEIITMLQLLRNPAT